MSDPADVPSASKFFGSFFQLIPWLKDIRTLAGIVIIIFIGFTIYRAYFMKTQQQTQHNTTTVTAQPGSHITVEAPKQEMKQDRRWQAGPFVGGSTHGDIIGGVVVLYSF